MSNAFAAWALCKNGEIIEIYKTRIGAQRGHTRFSGCTTAKNVYSVRRLKCLFDELEMVDGKR